MQHLDPNSCHDRCPLTWREKDNFQPVCTVIIEFSADRRILLGGHWAADYQRHLALHGVRAKCCLAGTVSRHRIHHSPHLQCQFK